MFIDTIQEIKTLEDNNTLIESIRQKLYKRFYKAMNKNAFKEGEKIGKLISYLEIKFDYREKVSLKVNKQNLNNNNLFVSKVNSKLRKSNITAFSLPEAKTCPFAGACLEFCYSPKASTQYTVVRDQRQSNWDFSKKDNFVENMIEYYKNEIWNTHRIHADGDFYSKPYVQKWFEIVSALPQKRFYAYTKSFLYFDLNCLPDNLLIIQSEGSKVDHLIDYTQPYARIYKSKEDLEKAGSHDCSVYDHEVFNAPLERGLIFH